MAVVPVVARGPEGEFGHVENAELDRAGGVEPLERRRGRRRGPLAQDLRAAGGTRRAAVVHVLVRHRHAVQRPARRLTVRETRGLESGRLVDAQEAVQPRLDPPRPVEHRFHGRDGARAAARGSRPRAAGKRKDLLGRHGAVRRCSAWKPEGSASSGNAAWWCVASLHRSPDGPAARRGSARRSAALRDALTWLGFISLSLRIGTSDRAAYAPPPSCR